MSTQSGDPLLQPFKLKHLHFKNRIMSTSHAPAYVEDRLPKERYQLYHEEKAKGGIALTMFGGSSTVAVDSPPAFGQIDLSDDRVIPYLREFAERVHRHDAHLMCQITHMGRRTSWDVDGWLPVLAPSSSREQQHRSFPKAMEDHDIERVILAYGVAALRVAEGGIDGVELLATGHLIDQFWSPAINTRADRYGGTFENRMRFGLEVMRVVRKFVGPGFVVGLRMSGDEMVAQGIDRAESLRIATYYAASGLIDFLNVTGSSVATDAALSAMIPGMGQPSAPFVDLARDVRAAVSIAVFHATRITDLANARHVIAAGCADMVAMTRAHIADPHIVMKLKKGQSERIRPCVGARFCIDRIYVGRDALCLHNPATGRESNLPHTVLPSAGPARSIVVVGGGPAGLEAARVCAERGHRVVLFEAQNQLGGQILLASRAPGRGELIGVRDWLTDEIVRLGVDIRCGLYAEAPDVLAEKPDVVIIATGGTPDTSFLLRGANAVKTTWDIFGRSTTVDGDVLLYDGAGQEAGITCAVLLGQDSSVNLHYITPDRHPAFDVGLTTRAKLMRDFYRTGSPCTPDLRLLSVVPVGGKRVATFQHELTQERIEKSFDHVITEHGSSPADDLYFALREESHNHGRLDIDALALGRLVVPAANPTGRFHLFRVGDAITSRNIHAALFDALRICKEL